MSHTLAGKVALVTGAARGIGRAVTVSLARAGVDVVALDWRPGQADENGLVADFAETRKLAGSDAGQVETIVADVRDLAQLEQAVSTGVERFAGLDLVVANAGVSRASAPAWEIPEDDFMNVVNVNLGGAWRTVKATAPHLIARGSGGSVVLIGSGASVKGLPGLAPYVASKHALVGLTRTMARDFGPLGIRVNLVLPGPTNTDLLMKGNARLLVADDGGRSDDDEFLRSSIERSPMRIPYVEPEDVADAVVWLLSDGARHVTGVLVPVDGGTAIP
jgi:NAD(P)-dependent dehydrogenase (short-subunit alcohol dehydrogenase family)